MNMKYDKQFENTETEKEVSVFFEVKQTAFTKGASKERMSITIPPKSILESQGYESVDDYIIERIQAEHNGQSDRYKTEADLETIEVITSLQPWDVRLEGVLTVQEFEFDTRVFATSEEQAIEMAKEELEQEYVTDYVTYGGDTIEHYICEEASIDEAERKQAIEQGKQAILKMVNDGLVPSIKEVLTK
jgi:hypothetical protein